MLLFSLTDKDSQYKIWWKKSCKHYPVHRVMSKIVHELHPLSKLYAC